MEKSNSQIAQLSGEAVQLLKQLIATPSVSRDEARAADVLEAYMQRRGLHPQRYNNNVWCLSDGFNPSRGPAILLNAHIDTVKPVAGWQHDPFTPTLEGDCLYGLGSNDCGGGLVSLLQVFIALNGLSQNLIFLASAEEEVSGKNGIESVLPQLPAVAFAIVGEPTGMQPAIAEKGLMVIDATAHGKAGHAARDEGDNAIYRAIQDIHWLSRWTFPKQSPLLGPVKQTVTIVNAGTQHNVVPDLCTFTIDVRSNECYTNEEIFRFFQQHLQSELKARSFRLSSSRIDPQHPFVQACIREGLTPFGSPTLSDQALMPFPSLKLGPGDSARSHTADEYIKISEIEHAISLYLKLINPNYEIRNPKGHPDGS
ncbi:MAG: M20 family metallo-hydrolase [Bacteroidaceae bacterium]|nr:M20 family metallo-hydrolase [Bacteroidaceae bacterium]